MDTKERHIRENESKARREAELEKEHAYATPDQIAESMPAEGKVRKNEGKSKSNRLWLWLGILILVFILLYWLFAIGTFEDLIGYFNG